MDVADFGSDAKSNLPESPSKKVMSELAVAVAPPIRNVITDIVREELEKASKRV